MPVSTVVNRGKSVGNKMYLDYSTSYYNFILGVFSNAKFDV